MEKIKIYTPYIKLGQFLKLIDAVSSGGQEKIFLLTKIIKVNGEKENRRGRKLVIGDKIDIEGKGYEIE